MEDILGLTCLLVEQLSERENYNKVVCVCVCV